MAILVTGGTGYIGSHTVIELLKSGKDVVIVDNLSNSQKEVLGRIRELADIPSDSRQLKFYEVDIRDKTGLDQVMDDNEIEAVIHFAGLKAVGESVEKPLDYYDNNIYGTLVLLKSMGLHGVGKIVFSSSATVYGLNNPSPLTEDLPLSATNPYGRTKLMIEEILQDMYVMDSNMSIILLRYFNPIGAHESGRIGEDPSDIPNNLMPYVTQVAVGKLDHLRVFGNDYDTPDGTGVRDYIHVVDLAKGHLKALDYAMANKGIEAINLGTGQGVSVLGLVKAFEKANDIKIPYEIVSRRPGDVATCYSDPSKAERVLGWKAEYDLESMCRDSWNWQKNNPNGYR